MNLFGIEILNPQVLYFMLPSFAIFIFFILNKQNKFENIFSVEMLERLKITNSSFTLKKRNIFMLLGVIFLILALSNPVILKDEVEIAQKDSNVVIAIDFSATMGAKDIYPTRFISAKEKAKELIRTLEGSRIGVVAFEKKPYLISPLSKDYKSLIYLIDNMDNNLPSSESGNLESALKGALNLLDGSTTKSLIVLSDGGVEDTIYDALNLAKRESIKIYSIGMATKKETPIEQKNGDYLLNESGSILISSLNNNLKTLSLESGGAFIETTLSSVDTREIANAVTLDGTKDKESEHTIKDYQPLFIYPALIGLFFIFISYHSLPKIFASFLLLLFVMPDKSYAFLMDFISIDRAHKHYENESYKEAIKEYEKIAKDKNQAQSHYNLANAYYKNGEFQKALDAYKRVNSEDRELESKKLYNIGNTLINLGEIEKAIENYQKSLELRDSQKTKKNLELAKELLKEEQDRDNSEENQENQENGDSQENQENGDSQENQENQDSKQNGEDSDKNKENSSEKKSQKNQESEDTQKENQDNKNQNLEEKSEKEDNKDEQNSAKERDKEDDNRDDDKSQKSEAFKELENAQGEISEMEKIKWMNLLEQKRRPTYLYELKND